MLSKIRDIYVNFKRYRMTPLLDKVQRQQAIQNALSPFCTEKGFQYLARQNQFRRSTPTGFEAIILSVSHYDDLSLLEIHLGIRNEQIERLAFPFTNGVESFAPDSLTIVSSIGKLKGVKYERHELIDLPSIKQVSSQIIDFLQSKGLAFLENYASITQIDAALNLAPQTPTPLMPNQAHRCLRAITAARLNDHSQFEQLTLTYRQRLIDLHTPAPLVNRYDRLVNFLIGFNVN